MGNNHQPSTTNHQLSTMNHRLLLAVACILMVVGCDIVDDPFPSQPGWEDTSARVLQNVLLEDYTGHTCGNCPEAADVAHNIQDLYGSDRVIVAAVHAGPFAFPQPPTYPADYQTPVGNELDQTFRISRAGNPNGLVNRTTYNGKFIQSKDNWAPATQALLAAKPKLGLSAAHTWDAASKTVTINVVADYLVDGTDDYYLTAWILENGIIGDQTDYRKNPSHVEDYEFEHVLRASVNGTWGEQMNTLPARMKQGERYTKTLSYSFPSDKTWVPENCDLVVFVHRYGAAREVVQVVKQKLVK